MTYRRNARRRKIQAGRLPRRPATASLYSRFWLTIEPARQRDRIAKQLARAEQAETARRDRRGVRP